MGVIKCNILDCSSRSTSCETCLKNVTCLWCNNPKKCIVYPTNHILPSSSDCGLSAARWGVCWCKLQVIEISVNDKRK